MASGGLATFAVLSPAARNTDAFDSVQPSQLTLVANGRATRFDFTGVLSTSFDLPFFVITPLIHHCVSAGAAGTLVVCSPHHKSREGRNTVLNMTCHLLPSLFAAAGPQCSEVAVQVVEVRHSSIIDALNIRRVTTIAEAEWTSVVQAGARVAWDAILEKLSERYSRGLASSEDSAFIVQMRLPNGGVLTLCDAGAAPTHLGNLTLVLNSGAAVPAEKRTIAPRIGLTFALEPLLPPQGLVHVLVLPEPPVDVSYTLRVLRFATQLHSAVPPLTKEDLFPDDTQQAAARGGAGSLASSPTPRGQPAAASAAVDGHASSLQEASEWRDEFTEYPSPSSAPHAAAKTGGAAATSMRPPLGTGVVPFDVATPDDVSAIFNTTATARAQVQGRMGDAPRQQNVTAAAPPRHHQPGHHHHQHHHDEVSSESDVSSDDDAGRFVSETPRQQQHQHGPKPRGLDAAPSPTALRRSAAALDERPTSPHALADAYLGPLVGTPSSHHLHHRAEATSPNSSSRGAAAKRSSGGATAPQLPPVSPSKTSGGLNASGAAMSRVVEPAVVQRLRDRLAECEEQLLQSRHTVSAFEAELQRARKANTELSEALDASSHENETLRGIANAAQQEGREMSDLLRKLSMRLTELQDASQAHRDETSGLQQAAAEATSEAEHLRRELHEAKRTLKLLETREKERVRNATLLRAAGGAIADSTAAGLASSKASVVSGSSAAGGKGRSSSVSKGQDAAATAISKKRLQELVNENAKLHLKVDAMSSEITQLRNLTRGSSGGIDYTAAAASRLGFAAPSTAEEFSALRTEVEVLRAQLATQAAEIDHLTEERAALQRVVVTHPRSNAASDVLMAVSQSCLRGLELLLSKMRAEVASATAMSGGNANTLRSLQQHRAAQIHAVEKLKASIVAVSQKDATFHIPASATANDADPMAQAMKHEIERLAHVKALLPTYAQLYAQCMAKRGAGDESTMTDGSANNTSAPPTFGKP